MTKREQRQALDEGLDRLLAGRPAGEDDLLRTAARVRRASRVRPSSMLAARHVDTALAADTAVVAFRSRRSRSLAVGLAAAAMLVLMASSAVAASSSALPGESFYGVKRAVERVRLALPGDAGSKAQLHLEFAERRLSELQELLARREAGEDVDVGAAMAAYGRELAKAERDAGRALAKGQDEDFITHVLAQIDRHVQRLEFLRDNKVPEQARDAIQRAIDNAEKAKGKVGHGRPDDPGKPDDAGAGRQNAPGQQKKQQRTP